MEASDFVGGISKLTVEAATSTDKSWTENQPLRVAVADSLEMRRRFIYRLRTLQATKQKKRCRFIPI